MTQEPAEGASSLKGGGGSREYMSEFARGRIDLDCESCGFNMRRNSDFGTEADGAYTERIARSATPAVRSATPPRRWTSSSHSRSKRSRWRGSPARENSASR